MPIPTNFYSAMLQPNGKSALDKTVCDEVSTVVQDEALDRPWTHRFTIYCNKPSDEFLKNFKDDGCVVAVFSKIKD